MTDHDTHSCIFLCDLTIENVVAISILDSQPDAKKMATSGNSLYMIYYSEYFEI